MHLLPRKNWCQVIRSAAPAMQHHFSKPEDLMLQNATHLRKSAPGPPNISDKHVSCTAPATENASLQILFKCSMPAIVFGRATKPACFAHFWQGAESLAPATQNHILNFKSGPSMWCFVHFDLEMCFMPQRRALFSTSQLPKVLRGWCAFCTLIWKCASRHNGMHFFDMSTSKSGLRMVCFVHFDFEMCFAPQRRALFRHLNFQKRSQAEVLCTFWLGKFASRHNGVHFFDMSISKSGLRMVWSVHFDLEMCFAPQRRALFRHLNFQKGSKGEVILAFSLQRCFAPQGRAIFYFSSGQIASRPPL